MLYCLRFLGYFSLFSIVALLIPVQVSSPAFIIPVVAQSTFEHQGKANQFLEEGIGHYEQNRLKAAIESFEKALKIYQEVNDRLQIADCLGYLGNTYQALGQDQKAVNYHQQQLKIVEAEIQSFKNGSRSIQTESSDQIKRVFQKKAYQFRINALNNLGYDYFKMGESPQAISYHEKALTLSQEIGDYHSEAFSLGHLGQVYRTSQQDTRSLDYYHRSLSLFREVGDQMGFGLTFINLAFTLSQQKKTKLAILFYKQGINTQNNAGKLTSRHRQLLTISLTDSYRQLADLLLQVNRVSESQKVLDLSRQAEIDRYIGHRHQPKNSSINLLITEPESLIWSNYQTLIDRIVKNERELKILQQVPVTERTSSQKQQINHLISQREQLDRQSSDFFLVQGQD